MSRFRNAECLLVLVAGLLTAGSASGELMVNGGFEDGLNGWTFTGNGTNDIAGLSSDTPSGLGSSADLDINRGAFGLPLPWLIQDVAVTAGSELTFSAWVREVEAATPTDAWIAAQIWMLPDSASGSILSSAAMFFTNSSWERQSTQITVPAGATIARVLFTPQNPAFGVGNGHYRVDDVSLVVPEPASALLLLIVGVATVFRRRGRSAQPCAF
jgi:arabinoxylan arabinofuranohydrolase